jgi:hypothetical protein
LKSSIGSLGITVIAWLNFWKAWSLNDTGISARYKKGARGLNETEQHPVAKPNVQQTRRWR